MGRRGIRAGYRIQGRSSRGRGSQTEASSRPRSQGRGGACGKQSSSASVTTKPSAKLAAFVAKPSAAKSKKSSPASVATGSSAALPRSSDAKQRQSQQQQYFRMFKTRIPCAHDWVLSLYGTRLSEDDLLQAQRFALEVQAQTEHGMHPVSVQSLSCQTADGNQLTLSQAQGTPQDLSRVPDQSLYARFCQLDGIRSLANTEFLRVHKELVQRSFLPQVGCEKEVLRLACEHDVSSDVCSDASDETEDNREFGQQ